MQIPFCGASYEGRSKNIDASRSINFFPELSSDRASKTPLALVGTPGCHAFATLPQTPIRMTYTFDTRLFAVAGTGLYEVYSDGTYSASLGTVAYDVTDYRVSAADNGVSASGVGGDQLCMVTSGNGYVLNISTLAFAQITDSNFPTDPKFVAYQDGHFIVTDGSMRCRVSASFDGLTWPSLAFFAAWASADSAQRPLSLHQEIFIIKRYTTEVYYNAGISTDQGSPFVRRPGAVLDFGTAAPWSVAKGANTVFFLANQRSEDAGDLAGVMMMNGYAAEPIAPVCINYRIQQMSRIDDAFGYCYTSEGHTFYVLTFPTDDLTFVYDLATRMWHERSSYTTGIFRQRRHLSDSHTYCFGKHLVGHYASGKILEMSTDFYDDDGEPIVSIRTASPLYDDDDLDNIKIHGLTVDVEGGVGDGSTNPSGTPQAWLSWSNDDGHTWSSEYSASMGKIGEYKAKLKWKRIGAPRNRVFQLRMPDKVKKVILGARVKT